MKISVIIPNYNRANVIAETLDNMLVQTRAPDEVIVVDDGSSDDSISVIKKFEPHVTLIRQANSGPGAARNRGFEASSGDLIQFMDSDDLASLNKLEIQADLLSESGADFAYCPWIRTAILDRTMEFKGPLMQASAIPNWKPMLEWAVGSWCIVFQNCLFRRNILSKAGRYRTDLMPTEDSEYFLRILLAGAQPIFTNDCAVFYRVEAGDQITADGTSNIARAKDLTKYYEIVGSLLEDRFPAMHASTRRELASSVFNHNKYCDGIGVKGTNAESAIQTLVNAYSRSELALSSFWTRVTRKLKRIPPAVPNQSALKCAKPDERIEELVEGAGYGVCQ